MASVVWLTECTGSVLLIGGVDGPVGGAGGGGEQAGRSVATQGGVLDAVGEVPDQRECDPADEDQQGDRPQVLDDPQGPPGSGGAIRSAQAGGSGRARTPGRATRS